MKNRYEGDQYNNAPPQLVQRTGQSSSSNDYEQQQQRLEDLQRKLQLSQNAMKVNEEMLTRQMNVICDKAKKERAMSISNKPYEPSIEDKLLNLSSMENIPYLDDNEIVEEFNYVSDEAWMEIRAIFVNEIKKDSQR